MLDAAARSTGSGALHRVDWIPAPAPATTAPAPWDGEVLRAPAGTGAAETRAAVATALDGLRERLADDQAGDGTLVVVTGTDPAGAAVGGLVRSAQSENPTASSWSRAGRTPARTASPRPSQAANRTWRCATAPGTCPAWPVSPA
ncbi:hypothetical protein, partial [Streptomyces flavovirens]|uniref:hypothetical protein n=1 Tax=Streptomyces flavovirens TaxID=52258 RepID=UPI0031E637CC